MSKKRNKGRGKQRGQRNLKKRARMAGQAGRAVQPTDTGPISSTGNPKQAISTVVALDPLAPLVIRSGRPFDGQAGSDAPRFPPPSTVAGCLRTAWARETGQSFDEHEHLRTLAVTGPLLLDRSDQILVHKPADAHYFGNGKSAVCVRAQPLPFNAGTGSDLPDGLLPVQLAERREGKPSSGPQWWSLGDLIDFRRGKDVPLGQLAERGWSPGGADRRTHVAIDRHSRAAEEGKLFQTEGLVLDGGREAKDAAKGGLRLLAKTAKELGPALVHLGGERRLASLEPVAQIIWPTPPNGWLQEIADSGGLCLTLLTPAVFSAGYLPGWLDAERVGSPPTAPGLRVQLCAVATQRRQAQSGWDLATQRPRPTRKLVPAGATYWFRILDGAEEDAFALWLVNVSDEEQDRLDGFGLAMPGPWTPSAVTTHKESK